MDINPWQVENIHVFSYFCCPECVYRSKEEILFQDHAITNHPHAQTFFNGLYLNHSEVCDDNPLQEELPHKDDKSIKKELDESVDLESFCQKELKVKEESADENFYDDTLFDDNDEMLDEDLKDEDFTIVPKTRGRPRKFLKTKKKEEPENDSLCGICNEEFGNSLLKDDHLDSMHLNEAGLFKCDECEEVAPDYIAMLKHKRQSHKRKKSPITHTCPTCQKIFTKKVRLRKHIESVHEKRRANCPHCNKEMSLHALRNHIKLFHKMDRTKKEFKCNECDFSAHTGTFLRTHVKMKHRKDEHQYACDQCDKKYAYESQLKIHKQAKHDGLKPYMCDKCGKGFGLESKAHFLRHVQNECRGTVFPDGIKCHSCEVKFTIEGNYLKHHIKVHGGLPPSYEDRELFICDQCSTLCISKKALKIHMTNSHSEKGLSSKKRASCPHCEKTFARKQACDEHVKVKHENSTPFKCDQCHRCYGTMYAMKQHKFSMHQRVKCDECGQEVSNTLILTRHKAKAHGIRPASVFQCKHCPLFYTLESQLEKHVMNHHLHQFD